MCNPLRPRLSLSQNRAWNRLITEGHLRKYILGFQGYVEETWAWDLNRKLLGNTGWGLEVSGGGEGNYRLLKAETELRGHWAGAWRTNCWRSPAREGHCVP